VPFTLQTFAVLLAGGVLGSRAGAASQLLYVLAGAVGLPVYAERSAGFGVLLDTTGGYLVGFIVAAWVVGKLAERRHDRRFMSALSTFLIGSMVIYGFGVAGLMLLKDLSFGLAVAHGVVPFVFWDILKAAAAGTLLPAAWRLTGER
jgi:biotin transport system substrate-specific component